MRQSPSSEDPIIAQILKENPNWHTDQLLLEDPNWLIQQISLYLEEKDINSRLALKEYIEKALLNKDYDYIFNTLLNQSKDKIQLVCLEELIILLENLNSLDLLKLQNDCDSIIALFSILKEIDFSLFTFTLNHKV